MQQCTITFEQDGRKAVVVVTEDYKVKTTFTPPNGQRTPARQRCIDISNFRDVKGAK